MAGRPSGAGKLESFLDDITMGALDFPRADRQTALYCPWIVQLGQAVTDIAVTRRDGVVVVVCFDQWRQC